MNAFGITGRKLVSTEIAYISRWTNEYGFDSDIILEACKRTMASLHQPNFKYTDSILSDWNKKQVHHLSDIAKLDAAHQERKKVPLPLPPIQHPKTSSTISRSAPTTTTNWSRCF